MNDPQRHVLKREVIVPVVTTRWLWTYVLVKTMLIAIATAAMMAVAQ